MHKSEKVSPISYSVSPYTQPAGSFLGVISGMFSGQPSGMGAVAAAKVSTAENSSEAKKRAIVAIGWFLSIICALFPDLYYFSNSSVAEKS
jgi:hypothetical protein